MTLIEDDDLICILITQDEEGQRLDKVLSSRLTDISRSRVQELLKNGDVSCSSISTPLTTKIKVVEGQEYKLKMPKLLDLTPHAEKIDLDIIYEDDDVIVINKPAGMVVHPGAGNESGTLVNALLYHCGSSLSGIGGVSRPGIVHRLDKETSGVMIVAKHDKAHHHLSAQFADHGRTGVLVRQYQALIWAGTPKVQGTLTTFIDRHRQNRLKMAVAKTMGREAITHYQMLDSLRSTDGVNERLMSQVICQLETGRTHQIRVHMEYANCPVLGDPLYATAYRTRSSKLEADLKEAVDDLDRQMLHAFHLTIAHPTTDETMTFETPPPADYQHIAVLAGFDAILKSEDD